MVCNGIDNLYFFFLLQPSIEDPADFDSPLFGPLSNDKSPKAGSSNKENKDSIKKEIENNASGSGSDSGNSR